MARSTRSRRLVHCGLLCAACGGLTRVDDGTEQKADASTIDASTIDASTVDASTVDEARRLDAAPDPPDHENAVVDSAANLDSPPGATVTGTIIDSHRLPMVGWRVLIGQAQAITDANGKFTIANVSIPYDVAFEVPGRLGTTALRGVWVYQGLTRLDPTLQAGWTIGPHERDLYVKESNVPTRLDGDGGQAETTLGFSFGSPDEVIGAASRRTFGNLVVTADWFGGNSITGTLHTLAWVDPRGPGSYGLDNEYLSYNEAPLTILDLGGTSVESQSVTLDFSPSTVPSAIFSASVRASWGAPASLGRSLYGSVVFDDNACISLLQVFDAFTRSSISARMPLLPRSSVVFSAHQGLQSTNFGFARGEAVSPDIPVVLDIPEPRTLVSPPAGAQAVDTGTTFEWSAGASVSVFSVECLAADISFHTVSVEHRRRVTTAPAFGAVLPKGTNCHWHVNVHGSFRSVDDAANPRGMIEPCLTYCEHGNQHGEGSGTVSEWRLLTTAP